jgi:hypothetical protein
MSKEIEIGIRIQNIYLEVSGTYHPEEPAEMYDSNMEGYPGYPAEFELQSVKVEGIEIIDLISDAIYDEIIDKVIENQQN